MPARRPSLDARLVMPASLISPATATARLLAARWDPLPSEHIHRELARSGHDMSLTGARRLLREHPALVAVPGRGFQLGRGAAAAWHRASGPTRLLLAHQLSELPLARLRDGHQ